MKIAILNHVHPDAPHVSALRMREFARVLAAQGDRVVLVTSTLHSDDPGDDPDGVARRLAAHDWAAPLHIACRPVGARFRRLARDGRIMAPFRQMVVGGAYLLKSGMFADWRAGAANMNAALIQTFGPDIVYGTFGNTDTWMAARALARGAGCPWVADYKDPWESFVPPGFRKIVAGRFSDMAAMTTFSETHLTDADKWFGGAKQAVYSGYPEAATASPTENRAEALHVCLSGSVYRPGVVRTLIEGINRVSSSRRIRLSYAGNDGASVARVARRLNGDAAFENHGYLPADALCALQKSAGVNAYVRNPESLFQQKLIELLAAGKPVLSMPDESAEAVKIAEDTGGHLVRAGTPSEIADAISKFGRDAGRAIDAAQMRAYSWAAQGKKLRRILSAAAGLPA